MIRVIVEWEFLKEFILEFCVWEWGWDFVVLMISVGSGVWGGVLGGYKLVSVLERGYLGRSLKGESFGFLRGR